MAKRLFYLLLFVFSVALASSCSHNKIACPTYADSAPQRKSKKPDPKHDGQPSMKVTKHKIGNVLPPGYIKAKKKSKKSTG